MFSDSSIEFNIETGRDLLDMTLVDENNSDSENANVCMCTCRLENTGVKYAGARKNPNGCENADRSKINFTGGPVGLDAEPLSLIGYLRTYYGTY